MFFRGSSGCLLRVMAVYVLASSTLACHGAEDPGAFREVWRDFGRLLLYRSGTGRGSSAAWLNRHLDVADPDSRRVVGTAEAILTRALTDYGQEAIAVSGRIPLNINPQCILGFHLAERFPGTRLGDWGGRQFDRCIEQACLVAMPVAGATWRETLATELLASREDQGSALLAGAFGEAEAPYLYLYLVKSAGSAEARNKARERLARCLWQGHGLGPGLRQYLVLLDQGGDIDGGWLDVATEFERTGAHSRAKKAYRRILRTTDSDAEAIRAFEGLARILLLESRHRDARNAWGVLSQRFPQVECTARDVRDFLDTFQFNRAETAKGFHIELAGTTNGPQALRLCRLLDALWTPEEALEHWHVVAERAVPGSLADQFARVFLARAMLNAGKADASETAVRGLTESSNPLVQARSLAVAAEAAQARGNIEEAARLYSRAVQIERPTALPPWYKGLLQVQPPGPGTSTLGLRAQTRFLRGCNDLIDGDYAAASDSFSQVAADALTLPDFLQRALPCMMMLAWLGLGDLIEAEAWGYKAVEKCSLDAPGGARTAGLKEEMQNVDAAISRLLVRVRDRTIDASSALAVLQDAIILCNAATVLDAFASRPGAAESGVQQMYVRAKKRKVARMLDAEYHYAVRRLAENETKERMSSLDSLLFAAQVLGDEPFDRIKANLSALPDVGEAKDRMYRLAVFAQKAGRFDLARKALDAAADDLSSADTDVLEGMAGMYLAASNHKKAIDAYERLVAIAEDPGKARSVQLAIIDIYAEDLKNYDKAIQECQQYIQAYPDSAQTSQVEFRMGKLSYLGRDYAGAVGQLDGFRRRYPEHPQVGQAMLLAGLSRMAEGNTQEAIGRFSEVIRRSPDGELAARSKFLIGYAQISSQEYRAALETFEQLIEQFPDSQYVSQAQSLIDRLSKVSR